MINIYTPTHWLHDTRDLYVDDHEIFIEERPERAFFIKEAILSFDLGKIIEPEDFGLDPILAVHNFDYIEFLKNIYTEGINFYGYERLLLPETFPSRRPFRRTNHPIGKLGYYSFGTYSPILKGTWNAAYWSAQCAITAANVALSENQTTYAICRPPGHHAGKDYYGGFCYLNNAAIAAKTLPGKVAVLDIDFHHGNGTQDILYDDLMVHYYSIHADPDAEFPYFWGGTEEKGNVHGEESNFNFPLPLGTTDSEYLRTLGICLQKIIDFGPDNLIISLGYDILSGDPAGGFNITDHGLHEIATKIANLTRKGLRTILIQEGGYILESLGKSTVTFFSEFQT